MVWSISFSGSIAALSQEFRAAEPLFRPHLFLENELENSYEVANRFRAEFSADAVGHLYSMSVSLAMNSSTRRSSSLAIARDPNRGNRYLRKWLPIVPRHEGLKIGSRFLSSGRPLRRRTFTPLLQLRGSQASRQIFLKTAISPEATVICKGLKVRADAGPVG
jgi:hypothetical protein